MQLTTEQAASLSIIMRKYIEYMPVILFSFALAGENVLAHYFEKGIHNITFVVGISAIVLSLFVYRHVRTGSIIDRILILFVLFVFYLFLNYNALGEYGKYKVTLMLWYLMPMIGSRILISDNADFEKLQIFMLSFLIIGTMLTGYQTLQHRLYMLMDNRYYFGDPIVVSRLFGVIIILAYSLRYKLGRLLSMTIILYGLYGIVMSGTRGAAIPLIMTFLLYKILYKQDGNALKQKDILVSSIFLLMLILFPVVFDVHRIFGESFGRLVFTIDTVDDIAGRGPFWRAAIEQWLSNIIWGGGTGSFPLFLRMVDLRLYPHNIILELLAENGIVGLMIFSLLMFYSIKYLRTNWNRMDINGFMFLPLCLIYGFLTALSSLDICNQKFLWIAIALIGINVKDQEGSTPKERLS